MAVTNKRKHPRVRARGVAANLRAQEVLKTGCMVENISAGGLLVRTEQALTVGTPVVMDLVRPGMKKMLKLSGRVVGVAERGAAGPNSPPGLRVMFDPMPDETSDRLGQLLRELGSGSGLKTVPAWPPPGVAGPRAAPPVEAEVEVTAPIAWSPPEGLDTTRAMSMDALRTVLAAADAPPPYLPKEPTTLKEMVEAALSPPPVPSMDPVAPSPNGGGDTRLMVQIRGLLMELGEVQGKLDHKERELADALETVQRLKSENGELRKKLSQAEDQIWMGEPKGGHR